MNPWRYTPEEKAWLRENIPGNSYKSIAEAFSEKFRTVTSEQIRAFCKNNKIPTGRKGYFKKGQISYNKGKKQSDYMSPEAIERTKATRFQKGNRPYNQVPVGMERNLIGYIKIKVAQPNVWKLKHRYLWEQAYGPIPEDHYVRFKDGNPMNFSLDNLMLVDKYTHMSMTRLGIQSPPPELFHTAVLVGKLDAETRKTIKERTGSRNP